MTIISCINRRCKNNVGDFCVRTVVKLKGTRCMDYDSIDENELTEEQILDKRIYESLDDSDYDVYLLEIDEQ